MSEPKVLDSQGHELKVGDRVAEVYPGGGASWRIGTVSALGSNGAVWVQGISSRPWVYSSRKRIFSRTRHLPALTRLQDPEPQPQKEAVDSGCPDERRSS